MSDSRNIYAPDLDLENLAQALTAWYRTEQYSIERSTTGKGMVVLKCRRANEDGKKRPSLLVTLRQQDAGLAADVEVFKANKGWLIAAMIVAPIVGLLSLTGGTCGVIVLLCAIVFCIFCGFSLAQGNMPARTFTVIEQFIASSQKISPSSAVSKQGLKGPTFPKSLSFGRSTPGESTDRDAKDSWDLGGSPRGSGRYSARDEPIGSTVHGAEDGWNPGESSRYSARDESIGTHDPSPASNSDTSAADEIAFSAFPRKDAVTAEESTRTVTCSCGEVNPSKLKFCEGCGKLLEK